MSASTSQTRTAAAADAGDFDGSSGSGGNAGTAKNNPVSRGIGHTQSRQVTCVLVGAGSRGQTYARYALENPSWVRLTAVAEPRPGTRGRVGAAHGLSAARCFEGWEALVAAEDALQAAAAEADAHLEVDRASKQTTTKVPKLAECAIVATQDALHAAPCVALLERGFHVLVEKPLAATAADCVRVAAAARASGRLFAVCHVLRYTPYSRAVRDVVASGRLGPVAAVHHLEPIGFYHMAHSYVRGSWRRADEATPILMAKSCHDVDWLRYVCGRPIRQVASMAALTHFRKQRKPKRAGDAMRCVDCNIKDTCTYSATGIYIDRAKRGVTGFPLAALVDAVPDVENITQAVKEGPYGRCVYECDNDQPDSQVVSLTFGARDNHSTAGAGDSMAAAAAGGDSDGDDALDDPECEDDACVGSFTMEAFTQEICQRMTRIGGPKGELIGDMKKLTLREFGHGGSVRESEVELPAELTSADTSLSGHWGADWHLANSFFAAVANDDPSLILSGPDESLETHMAVFAAEHARKTRTVVDVAEFTTRMQE